MFNNAGASGVLIPASERRCIGLKEIGYGDASSFIAWQRLRESRTHSCHPRSGERWHHCSWCQSSASSGVSAVVGILPVVLVDGAPGVVQIGALGPLLLLAVAAVALRRPKVEVKP